MVVLCLQQNLGVRLHMSIRIYLGCSFHLLTVGCGRRSADRESVDTVIIFQAAPPAATQDSTLGPGSPVIVAQGQATVPDQFRGKWAGSQSKCGVPSESSLAIHADRVDFYESRGRVLAVKVVSEREIEVELESSGEGQVWRSPRRFGLAEDGLSLTDLTMQKHPTVRVRCAEARVGP